MKECFQIPIRFMVDSDTGMPFRCGATFRCQTAASIADAVAFELDRVPSAVTNLSLLFLLKLMVAISRQQQEPLSVSDVLHVCEAAFSAISPLSLRQSNFILRDEFLINALGILPMWDSSGRIVPVTMAQVADGNLLNEAFRGLRDATI